MLGKPTNPSYGRLLSKGNSSSVGALNLIPQNNNKKCGGGGKFLYGRGGSMADLGNSQPPDEPHLTPAHLGQLVCIAGTQWGLLRYFGPTQFQGGTWCGVQLNTPVGKNDGSVGGVRYFDCPRSFGIFVPLAKVTLAKGRPSMPALIKSRLTLGNTKKPETLPRGKSIRPPPTTACKPDEASAKRNPVDGKKVVKGQNPLELKRRRLNPDGAKCYSAGPGDLKLQRRRLGGQSGVKLPHFLHTNMRDKIQGSGFVPSPVLTPPRSFAEAFSPKPFYSSTPKLNGGEEEEGPSSTYKPPSLTTNKKAGGKSITRVSSTTSSTTSQVGRRGAGKVKEEVKKIGGDEKVAQLQRELTKEKDLQAAVTRDLEERHAERVEQLRQELIKEREFQAEMTRDLEERHTERVEQLQQELIKEREFHAEMTHDLEERHAERVEQLQQELIKEREFHAEMTHDLAERQTERVVLVQTDYEQQLQQLRKGHEEEVGELRRVHAEELDRVTAAHKLQLQLRDNDHRTKLDEHRKQSPHDLLVKEVDSLLVVVEMRNEEIRELRRDLILTNELLEELEGTRETNRTLGARVEDLEAQLDKGRKDKQSLQLVITTLEEAIQALESHNSRLLTTNDELSWQNQTLRTDDDSLSSPLPPPSSPTRMNEPLLEHE